MNFSYDRFSDSREYHLDDPKKVRSRKSFPEALKNVRRRLKDPVFMEDCFGKWQTKPFVADQNNCIITDVELFAALEDYTHLQISVVKWHGSEQIDLQAARVIVARICNLNRKQNELRDALDSVRLVDVDRKSVELDLARFHIVANNHMR